MIKENLQFLEEKKLLIFFSRQNKYSKQKQTFQTKTNIPNINNIPNKKHSLPGVRLQIRRNNSKKNFNLKKKSLRFLFRSAVANAVTSIQPSAGGR